MKLEKFIFPVALILFGGMAFALQLQSDKIAELKRNKAELSQSLSEQIAINTTQQERIKHLAEQDAKHLQVLANAKSKIDELHTASLAHPERVYVKAKCPVPKTTAPSGMDDATPARPTDSAIRNYWLLRERIATSEQMILGLQEYVRTQCR
ncbi:phosphoprotein phosphatase [Xenorhabdus beddingii]|uniref:Phosphoprotein phosphatase n=1 Tax=Xenorhabdus beddingii TaxID=40578 RepID=A0A1Y2SJ01_9GAMM|nr:lysis protein [Xenorhabdus beddingii]OTA18862.1 phosphoprotein phosphatase [Xenorhabdus beddingii]